MHLTGPHEWDPSVLNYSYPSDAEPKRSTEPNKSLLLTLKMMNVGITPKGQFKLTTFWMTHLNI